MLISSWRNSRAVKTKKKGIEVMLKIIECREVLGRDFRIYGDCDNPLFLAKDVAAWIEHSNARMMLQTIMKAKRLRRYTP